MFVISLCAINSLKIFQKSLESFVISEFTSNLKQKYERKITTVLNFRTISIGRNRFKQLNMINCNYYFLNFRKYCRNVCH